MNTIVSTVQQYAARHPVECVTSIVSAVAFGVYFSWWKRTEDKDLIEDEDEDEDVKEIPKQSTQQTTTQATKAKVERPPPPPPKDDLIDPAFMAQCDGSNPDLPIYVAIRGHVFDVSNNKDSYGPGKGYNVFCGKDSSKALGKSSLKLEDCVPDVSQLSEKELHTLDQWFAFFSKRYPIVGKLP